MESSFASATSKLLTLPTDIFPAIHFAVYVTSSAYLAPDLYSVVVSSTSLNHPTKVYPSLVGTSGV